MAKEQNLQTLSFVAAADFRTTGQYRFVEGEAVNGVTVCNAAGEKSIGVAQNNPNTGEALTVAYGASRTPIVAGAAITIGAKVTTDNQGRAIPAVTTGHTVLGEAIFEAAAAAGEVISIKLTLNGVLVP